MADTFTTTLSLTKPEVGASADTWGTKLNDNLDDIDALFSAGPVLKVANGGTAATTASGARTSLGLGTMATQDASAVAITGGTAVFTGTIALTASASVPRISLYETGADADEKRWGLESNGGALQLFAINDAYDDDTLAISIARTGTTVDSIALAATAVTINGNAAFHAGTFTAPSSGSFTANLRASDGGAVLTSGTAYWKKFNGVVTLMLPALSDSSSATVYYIDSLPADIRSTSNIYLTCHGYSDGTQGPIRVQVVANDDILYLTKSDASAFTSATTTKGILQTVLTWVV
jgi:hypothetical protein